MVNQLGKRLVILGGGISGLSYIHYLRTFAAALSKTSHISKVTLLEANNYMGGSIKSQVYEDGVIHELGPRSVRISGIKSNNTVVLLEHLGLGDKVMTITDKSSAGKNRYIYNNGQLHRVPSSPAQIFSRLPASNITLGGAIYNDLFKPKMNLDEYPDQDPPLYEFIKYRFGEEAAENVLDPLMRGITAGDARKISTKSIFGDMLLKEQAYGSIIKGLFKPPVTGMTHDELFPNDMLSSKLMQKFRDDKVLSYNISTGLQTITEHLSNSLLNTNEDGVVSIYNTTKALSINLSPSVSADGIVEAPCSVDVQTVDGDQLRIPADHIVSAIPSKDLTKLLPASMPAEQRAALENITKIPHSPVGCVTVEYRGISDRLPKEINSFGFLTQSKSGSRVLGISFDSSMFPQIDKPHGSTRMTCMIGGSWFKEVMGTDNVDQVSDVQLEEVALSEIRKILKIEEDPYRISTLLWKTGIAQYTPGHDARLKQTRDKIEQLSLPLTLIGQSYDGVAVNDVIYGARMAAYGLVKSL